MLHNKIKHNAELIYYLSVSECQRPFSIYEQTEILTINLRLDAKIVVKNCRLPVARMSRKAAEKMAEITFTGRTSLGLDRPKTKRFRNLDKKFHFNMLFLDLFSQSWS